MTTDFDIKQHFDQWVTICEWVDDAAKSDNTVIDLLCESCESKDSCEGPKGGTIVHRLVKFIPLEQALGLAEKREA